MATKRSFSHILWPLGVIGMLVVSLSVCTITVIAATSDSGFAIEDDYYAKAVAWDDTAFQRAKNDALGWTVDAVISPDGVVRMTLLNAEGEPISDARIHAVVFHHAARGDAEDVTFSAAAHAGHYTAHITAPRHGLWQIRAIIRAQGEIFTSTMNKYASESVQ
ncbi:MAG: FixH family protein [Planctomycetota bacterium]